MFGIGMQEILVVLVIALVVIGPKKLPELAKSLGKGYGEFRRAFEEMKNTVNVDMQTEEEKENIRRIHESAASTPPPPAPEATPTPAAAEERQVGPTGPGEGGRPAAPPTAPYDNRDKEVEGGGD